MQIANGLTSRTAVMVEAGFDPDEIWAQLEAEAERLGPILPPAAATSIIVDTSEEKPSKRE